MSEPSGGDQLDDLAAENRRLRQAHLVTLEKLAVLQQQVGHLHRREVAAVDAQQAVVVPPPPPLAREHEASLRMKLGRQQLELESLLQQNKFLRADNSRLLAEADSVRRSQQQSRAKSRSPTRDDAAVQADIDLGDDKIEPSQSAAQLRRQLLATIQTRRPLLDSLYGTLSQCTQFPVGGRLVAVFQPTAADDDQVLVLWLEEFLTAVDFYVKWRHDGDNRATLKLRWHRDAVRELLGDERQDQHKMGADAKNDEDEDDEALMGRLRRLVADLRAKPQPQPSSQPPSKTAPMACAEMDAISAGQWRQLVADNVRRHQRDAPPLDGDQQHHVDLLMQWLAESRDTSATMTQLTELVEAHVEAAAKVHREKAALNEAVMDLTEQLDARERAWLAKYRQKETAVRQLTDRKLVLEKLLRHYAEEFNRVLALSPLKNTADDNNKENNTGNSGNVTAKDSPLPFHRHFQFLCDSLASANHALRHAHQQHQQSIAECRKLQLHRDALQRQSDSDQHRIVRLESDVDAARHKMEVVQAAVDEIGRQYDDALAKNSELEARMYRVCEAFQHLVLQP